MSEAKFAQEIMAEFRDLTQGKAYLSFSSDNIRTDNPFVTGQKYNKYLPIYVGLDFNISPMSWCLAQRRGEHMHFVEEISIKGTNTQEVSKVFVA